MQSNIANPSGGHNTHVCREDMSVARLFSLTVVPFLSFSLYYHHQQHSHHFAFLSIEFIYHHRSLPHYLC